MLRLRDFHPLISGVYKMYVVICTVCTVALCVQVYLCTVCTFRIHVCPMLENPALQIATMFITLSLEFSYFILT